MEARQLSELCIDGSRRVYEYVSKRRYGGAEEITVDAIEHIEEQEFKFKLSRSIFDLDSITFLFSDGDRRYFENDEISILLYDQEQRFVIVKTSLEVGQLIHRTIEHPNAWKLVFDLKFLIKRVIEWYQKNGDDLLFLEGRSRSHLNFDRSVIFADAQPSKQQMEAISVCFDSSLSYIWGAPGTGKTRFVLSYALLTYIKHDGKALILAPTNLALEQIFRGVIDVIERANIDKHQLLRIGTPSKSFATQHGQVCEDKGLGVKLAQLHTQIDILQSIATIDRLKKPYLEAMLVELTWLDSRQKLVRFSDSTLSKLKSNINSDKTNLVATNNSIKAHKSALDKSTKKSAKTTALLESLQRLTIRKKQIVDKLSSDQKRCIGIDIDLKRLTKIVKKKEAKLQVLADKAGVKDADLSLISVTKLQQDSVNTRARLFSMAQEYEQFAEHEMGAKLRQYKSDSATLKAYSTDARLISANVIGMTLDSFIARSKDKPIEVDHVFIDEAGYASLVKVLPAFITSGPITLLGDHKQLQPVCELSRDDILKSPNSNAAFVWDLSAIHCESVWTAKTIEIAAQDYQQQRIPDFKNLNRSALTTSFRFGKKLASVLGEYVYHEEGFDSGLEEDTKLSIFNVQNHRGFDAGDIGRRANMSEALCVLKIIEKGIVASDDFAVLTPYRDQVSLLAKLKPELADHDRLLTVHKSQGREWHTVIYSVCDIGNGASPWFTDSTNSLSGGLSNVNTAVSRAKKHLIIVCDSHAWEAKSNQLISGLIGARSKRYQYQIDKG
ncbi:MAG: hypothetical protein ACJAQ6_001300 [Arenicella sp.]|jgi:hypothetical protein